MRLKRLQLQGFKTFVPRTELHFGEGLTAIVGPNGSGKSNIADAVRWVLGEQSLSNLRAKKTEDLIFAGSSKRAPVSMAEVSITIDNSDHLLPLDFSEVTLTRRAYRSGENEYYINKSRVRLRDVLDVASTLGQAYTVVGQGLVDAALSLRPEERRELFEEAAAIRGYFVQREDALRRLQKTEENVQRIADLAAELEPQVRRMERQARQAQEYGKVQGELHALLEKWYATRWLGATAELHKAEKSEDDCRTAAEARRSEAAAISARLSEARTAVWQLVDRVSALHEQRAQAQSRLASQAQAQAVLAERLSSAAQQRESLLREGREVEAALQGIESQLRAADEEIKQRRAEIATLEEAGQEVGGRLAEMDRRIAEQRGHLRDEAARIDLLNRRLAELENRLAEGRRQRQEQETAANEGEAAISALRQKLETQETLLDERKAAVSQAQRAIAEGERELGEAQAAQRRARDERAALEERKRELSRQLDGLASQMAALAGEQQANMYGGVRAVVAAAKDGRLEGYVGTVAELLRVPAQYETAIEAALGGRLQEIVMSRWADVEQAIALLKQAGAGRATFLPLDTLRAGQPPGPPQGEGIVGAARDLVEYDRSLAVVADSLLGRLLIVEDLLAARRTLAGLPPNSPWMLATLGGEVVRPGGSVTGGSNARAEEGRARGRTVLGRERKRRELQQAQEKVAVETREVEQSLKAWVAVAQECEAGVARLSGMLEEARKRQMAAQMAHVEEQGALARLQQELSWRVGLLAETKKTLELLAAQESGARRERGDLEGQIAPLREELAGLEARARKFAEERASVASEAGDGATRLAVLAEGLRNLLARRDNLRAEEARMSKRAGELKERAELATREEADVAQRREEYAAEVALLGGQLQEIEAQVGPSERKVRELEAEVSRIEAEQSAAQERLLESDTHYSRAAVERQRCVGVLDSLRVEIVEELGVGREEEQEAVGIALARARAAEGYEGEPPWLRWEVAWAAEREEYAGAVRANGHTDNGHADFSPVESAELERRVYALKAKLSRLGPVNPLAMEEHATLVERHDFLETQLKDLTVGADGLRRVIAELDRTMRDQFAVTFAQVNEAFTHYFTLLFGGGTAQLELTNPDDVSASGVELMAQPPGKRMQPLAALSGGERALTSAALLFALLKVRPVPFCVLDEVDAALDESNVARFGSALKELEERTQFVVVTHNRGTIEAADTLYGVSMAGDGTSQMLSLKVDR